MRKHALRLTALLLVLLLCPAYAGCSRGAERHEFTWLDYFDTVITATAYTATSREFERFKTLTEQELIRLDALFDVYDGDPDGNGLAAVNAHAGSDPVTVDPDVLRLLQWAKEAAEVPGG